MLFFFRPSFFLMTKEEKDICDCLFLCLSLHRRMANRSDPQVSLQSFSLEKERKKENPTLTGFLHDPDITVSPARDPPACAASDMSASLSLSLQRDPPALRAVWGSYTRLSVSPSLSHTHTSEIFPHTSRETRKYLLVALSIPSQSRTDAVRPRSLL